MHRRPHCSPYLILRCTAAVVCTDFEGGVRVAAFASGGLVTTEARGTRSNQIVHICDMWTTFGALAGLGSTDTKAAEFAGVPPPDSLNVFAALTELNGTSPRWIPSSRTTR